MQRVAIARALSLEPEILICDEATSALDVSVQKRIVDRLLALQKEKNVAIAFICHDIALIRLIAHRVAVMYLGNVVEIVPGRDLCHGGIMHPYTRALKESLFTTGMDFDKPIECIDSEAPSPLNVPEGCPFHNRCDCCTELCRKEKPPLVRVEEDHWVACHEIWKTNG